MFREEDFRLKSIGWGMPPFHQFSRVRFTTHYCSAAIAALHQARVIKA